VSGRWTVKGTDKKSEASKIHVVAHEKSNRNEDTAISLYTVSVDGERIFLTPEKRKLAAKGGQNEKDNFFLVSPMNYEQKCDIFEWQRRQPLCLRRRCRKRIRPLPDNPKKFVALSKKEGSNATPVMKEKKVIQNAVGWTGQFLIEPVM
jgi:hypothetical protein